MIHTERRVVEISLSSHEFGSVVAALSEAGWVPAIREREHHFLKVAGVDGDLSPEELLNRRGRHGHFVQPEGKAELFFLDDALIYVILGSSDLDPMRRQFQRSLLQEDAEQVEVGAIGTDAEQVKKKLQSFADAFEAAVMSHLDGRRTRHMDFTWQREDPESERIQGLSSSDEAETEVVFKPADLKDEEKAAARVLGHGNARRLAQQLSEAGFTREQDLLARRKKEQQREMKEVVDKLKDHGAVNTEYLLECRSSGTPLTRVPTRKILEDGTSSELVCGTCGKPYKDEALHEGYALSDLGKRLMAQSHWMTIWVTDVLNQLGIPLDQIIWNMSEAGEEVDIVAEFLGELWILELKDREFGAGDAHPFNYRQVRYGADRAIIVSTERVSKDAKRVFRELAKETPRRRASAIVYVEGLDNAAKVIGDEVSKAALAYAHRRMTLPSELLGYDLRKLMVTKFDIS